MASMSAENLDYVLEHIVGGSGLYQWRTYLLMFPVELITGVTLFLHLFSAYTPQHRQVFYHLLKDGLTSKSLQARPFGTEVVNELPFFLHVQV